MPAEYVESTKGHKHLIYDGYKFDPNGQRQDKIHWKCTRRNLCHATAITRNDYILSVTGKHKHPPDHPLIIKLTLISNIKKRLETDGRDKQITQLYKEESEKLRQTLSKDKVNHIPTFDNIKTGLYSKKKRFEATKVLEKENTSATSTTSTERDKLDAIPMEDLNQSVLCGGDEWLIPSTSVSDGMLLPPYSSSGTSGYYRDKIYVQDYHSEHDEQYSLPGLVTHYVEAPSNDQTCLIYMLKE